MAAAAPTNLSGLPYINLTLPIRPETEKIRTTLSSLTITDIKKNAQLTRAFISLPTVKNVGFNYNAISSASIIEEAKKTGSTEKKTMFDASSVMRIASVNATINTVNDVRIMSSLNETFKFYFKYPEVLSASARSGPLSNVKNAVRAGERGNSHTYGRGSSETVEQKKIREQVIKMRDSVNFAIDQINKDEICLFDGNSDDMSRTRESFFAYFDKNLFGKKNLCIDGQNIGYSMWETKNLVEYSDASRTVQTSRLCDLFLDKTKNKTVDSPSYNICTYPSMAKNAVNIYGINYNVVCKLIDLLSDCQEELKFDNYVVTMQRHSIIDFFWSINTHLSHRRNVDMLKNINSSTGKPLPICIKYQHRGKNIYFVSLPIAPPSGIPGVIGSESDDYLAMLLGLRYRSKFFTRDKFKWLDGVILKRLFTNPDKYDYYKDNSLFIDNNLIQYVTGRPDTIHLDNLFHSHIGYLEEVSPDEIMYFPPIPSQWATTIPHNINVPRASPTMNTTPQIYHIRRAYVTDITNIDEALKQPLVQAQSIYADYLDKITEFRDHRKIKTVLIREIEADSNTILLILDKLHYNRNFIDTGVIKEIFIILRRMLRETSDIKDEPEPAQRAVNVSIAGPTLLGPIPDSSGSPVINTSAEQLLRSSSISESILSTNNKTANNVNMDIAVTEQESILHTNNKAVSNVKMAMAVTKPEIDRKRPANANSPAPNNSAGSAKRIITAKRRRISSVPTLGTPLPTIPEGGGKRTRKMKKTKRNNKFKSRKNRKSRKSRK